MTKEEVNNRFVNALNLECFEDIRQLINDENININSVDIYGNTALILACIYGFKNTAELILKNKNVDVNIKNKRGNTALFFACDERHIEIIELLLNHKDVDVNIQYRYGMTILNSTCSTLFFIDEPIIKLLLENQNIDVDIKDEWGDNALMKVKKNGHTNIIKLLENHINKINKILYIINEYTLKYRYYDINITKFMCDYSKVKYAKGYTDYDRD